MENTVLGNALEGVPEESSEEGEKHNDSKIESADNLDGLYLKSFVCWLKLITLFCFFHTCSRLDITSAKRMFPKNLQMDGCLSFLLKPAYIKRIKHNWTFYYSNQRVCLL